jgi:hypothetical protein
MEEIGEWATDANYHLTGLANNEDWWRFDFYMGNNKNSDCKSDEWLTRQKIPKDRSVNKILGWVNPENGAVSGLGLYNNGEKLLEVGI